MSGVRGDTGGAGNAGPNSAAISSDTHFMAMTSMLLAKMASSGMRGHRMRTAAAAESWRDTTYSNAAGERFVWRGAPEDAARYGWRKVPRHLA